MPRDWSPEARAAFGAKMKQVRAAAKTKTNGTAVPEPASVAPAPPPNPIATDVLDEPRRLRRRPPIKPPTPDTPLDTSIAVTALLQGLSTIPLDHLTYDECGLLLNSLSAASTSVALVRRQRQEQLESGTQRAICKTCQRPIDISKSGGFQILTERDEHHMPINRYYCSQNCLLARNMPSHAKQTPKQKQANQA